MSADPLVEDYKIVRFHEAGGPEVLKLERTSLRRPGAGEVALKVLAIGMAQGDAMYRSGTYLEKPDFPSGLGTEICGEIIAVGDGVTKWKVGDRVSSLSSMSINKYPIYGEYALLPEFSILRTPSGFSNEEGASFSLAFVPFYFALKIEANLQVGNWVVLNAAAATTSMAAAQIAKMSGARVIGLLRSEDADKVEFLKSQAFDHVLINDDQTVDTVNTLTGGGAHIILDPVCGPDSERLSEMARWRATIIHYGALAGPVAHHSMYQMAPKFLTIKGFTIYGYTGSMVMGLERDERAIDEVMDFLEYGVSTGALKPVVAKTYALDDIVQAHLDLQSGAHSGKLVVLPG